VVEALVNAKANIEARGSSGTALELAVLFGHRDVADFLLTKGAKLDAFMAAGLGEVENLEKMLKEDPGAADREDSEGRTPLHWAAYTGQKAAAELLLKSGAKVNHKSKGGGWVWNGTPLHFAAWEGRKGLVDLLLDHDADVNARDSRGRTPLWIAVYRSHKDVVDTLLDHRADVNACENQVAFPAAGSIDPTADSKPSLITPLHMAALEGTEDIVKCLLAHKADVNAKTSNGDTPLSFCKDKAVAELIRKAGGKE
jgi:ankyrin repeat protein